MTGTDNLDRSAADVIADVRREVEDADERAVPRPERIGAFRILGVLGRGGMGIVYRARQENAERDVALKITPGPSPQPSARHRIEREAKVLARLQHPGIAQLYEVGMADIGYGLQTFFAVELVRGTPLTMYAERQNLDVQQKLDLLCLVCDAVQHAHARGVVHRDLKPRNILVDENGQPKILDFGVAQLVDTDVQATTRQTDVAILAGTLPYMSPEQVQGDTARIDARSDVYSLGVVGYLLLTGRLPLDPEGRSFTAIVRAVCEEEPSRLGDWNRDLRGDLDLIFAKTLEKDRQSRYVSASELAADIRRYLRQEPILARVPGAWYRAAKFVRRHKGLVGSLGTIFVLLVSAVLVSASLYVRSVREASKARQTLTFLENMLESMDPYKAYGAEMTVRALLERMAERIEAGVIPENPEIQVSARRTIGEASRNLGLYDLAESQLRKAETILRLRVGEHHPDTLRARSKIAQVVWQQGKLEEAQQQIAEIIEEQRRALGDDHPDTLFSMNLLGTIYRRQGKLGLAEQTHRKTLEIRRRVLGEEHADTLMSWSNLGVVLYVRGDHRTAEEIHRKTLETRSRVLGGEHPDTLASMNNLGITLVARGKFSEAEQIHRSSVDLLLRILGDRHPQTLTAMENLGLALANQRKCEELERHVAWHRQRLPEGDAHLDTALLQLGKAYIEREEYASAEPLFVESLESRRRTLAASDPKILAAVSNLGNLYARWGRHEQGVHTLEPVVTAGSLPDDPVVAGMLLANYGICLNGVGRYEDAERPLLDSYDKLKAALGPSHLQTIRAVETLTALYTSRSEFDKAAEWQEKLHKGSSTGQERR